MSLVIGIDVGGSTTKIVGFSEKNGVRSLIDPLFVSANDPLTSLYGAFGKFIDVGGLSLEAIDKVMTTGVGSSFLNKNIYDLHCVSVPEFDSIGRGGLYLSGCDDCIVASLGTGTALVHATRGKKPVYLGGTGVGGGTLMGLSKLLLGLDNVEHIGELAEDGDLSRIDLRISDLTAQPAINGMPDDMTASNFGNLSDLARPEDIARGIMNLVFETVGVSAMFAARSCGVKDIVLTGNLTHFDFCRTKFADFNRMYRDSGAHFLIPENAGYATVIGTALAGFDDN